MLGDMLELGEGAPQLHIGLKEAVDEAGVDLIFACGRHMKGLYDALPEAKKGSYALTAASLEEILTSNLRRGDVVMVKASNGTGLVRLSRHSRRNSGKTGQHPSGIAAYTGEVSPACSMSSSISAIRSAR